MQSSTMTVTEKANLKTGMTPEGKQVLSILQTQYQMNQDAALRLMRDGGEMLAIAVLTRGRMTRGLTAENGRLQEALRKANKQNTNYKVALQMLLKRMEG